jgi:hypothetical protein
MTSTRLKNQPGEYKLEQLRNRYTCSNRLSEYRTISNNTALPELGFNVSHLPNHLLAENAVDIESSLFGVGSTNLDNPTTPVEPNLNILQNVSFFEKPDLVLPVPFVHKSNQRPIIP